MKNQESKTIYPCCRTLQKRLLSECSKISLEGTDFILHNGEGYNPETINYCPYCGSRLKTF